MYNLPSVSVKEIPSDAVLLDVREPMEWTAGHIDGAVHVPMNQLPARLQFEPGDLSPENKIVVICKMGSRSAHVTAWLLRQGFDAANLEGGMLAWAAARKPMISESADAPFVY